ncbi:hypothetical protein CERSUDRAFT_95002 [Gelatoporia subvermispora B]|uniref:Uncharacterized protein n=1 Tax=Ceriporiopsis subvermispora (strain B) TaxID=914234 RepID=M2PKB1_CERS8|nr:hypothetical protein CERSUDRAFT_101061 [Gelatoporia subvermispora B]EMD36729.1 hypothetical protein CERSUDRAFT_95002 [Gelatoporia subvermispora B]
MSQLSTDSQTTVCSSQEDEHELIIRGAPQAVRKLNSLSEAPSIAVPELGPHTTTFESGHSKSVKRPRRNLIRRAGLPPRCFLSSMGFSCHAPECTDCSVISPQPVPVPESHPLAHMALPTTLHPSLEPTFTSSDSLIYDLCGRWMLATARIQQLEDILRDAGIPLPPPPSPVQAMDGKPAPKRRLD